MAQKVRSVGQEDILFWTSISNVRTDWSYELPVSKMESIHA